MSTPSRYESKVATFVASLAPQSAPTAPRALVVNAEGSTLFDSGDTSLPVALTGVTNLVTLAMVLRDIDRGALALDTAIADILPSATVRGLCVIGDTDHSFSLTIDDLLSHRSGIVDYLTPSQRHVRSLSQQFLEHDRAWTLDQALEVAKHYAGLFRPGSTARASYSSTNYLLLGAILHETTGMKFDELVRLRIAGSLGLRDTYAFGPDHYSKYYTITPIHQGSSVVRIPQALASSGADGSIISTPKDTVNFLRAFWRGELFDASWLPRLTDNTVRSNNSPQLGRGVMVAPERFSQPTILGHSGLSGVAAGIEPATQTCAFLSNFQWTPSGGSFAHLTTLLRTAGTQRPS